MRKIGMANRETETPECIGCGCRETIARGSASAETRRAVKGPRN